MDAKNKKKETKSGGGFALVCEDSHENERMSDTQQSQAWKDWFSEYGPRLLLFARQQTRSAADADDVLQDAVLRLWRADAGLTGDGKNKKPAEGSGEPPDLALAYTAIRHAAIDHARKNDRRVAREQKSDFVVDVEEEGGRVDWFGSHELEQEERKEMIESAVQKLPEKFREVLTLKIWGDLTFAQIGEQLEISQNTAASRYRYAMENLKKTLVKPTS